MEFTIEELNKPTSVKEEGPVPAHVLKYIQDTKPSVVILTPCYNSSVYVTYTESLLQTMFMCKDLGIEATVLFCRNDSLVSRARNNLIAKAMHNYPKATHFLFIDADITWSPIDILKLLVANKPLVGGIYPIKNYDWSKMSENPEYIKQIMDRKSKSQLNEVFSNKDYFQTNMVRYNINYESSYLEIQNNLAKIKHLPTGFMLIKRQVIELMNKAFPQTKYVDDVNFLTDAENDFAYALFDCGVEDGHYYSEDWMFCHRWTKMGGSIYTDITVNLDHTGIETYKGSFITSLM